MRRTRPNRTIPAVLMTAAIVLFTACAPASFSGAVLAATATAPAAPLPTLTQVAGSAAPTATPSSIPTSQPELSLWISPLVPSAMLESITLPHNVQHARSRSGANLYLEPVADLAEESAGVGKWVFALVAPFPTVTDGVSSSRLQKSWQGEAFEAFEDAPLMMSSKTLALIESLWGPAAPGSVRIMDPGRMVEATWQNQPAWAIIPFEEIEPRWKVLRVDSVSPLDREFDPDEYALSFSFQLHGKPEAEQALKEQAGSGISLASNRDPDKLTVLVMTGVTALARNTAVTMEEKGVTYPGISIGSWLREADLTHISNEVSFSDDCPPGRPDARFCSPSRYIDLLEDVGTDIVELTGNHNLDWGYNAYTHSLEMYADLGWLVYGGGATPESARQPVLIEHNGTRLAFLGCNAAGPEGAWANEYHPGAAICDFEEMEQEIKDLVEQGYLPVVSLQHLETDNYHPEVAQRMPDFRRMAQAGAVIVSGSQSHYPQTMTFVGENFVHYGLGNLFFDQMDLLATRQEFIDRHVFYNGRYLGVELLTALLEESARPRPMGSQERTEFLEKIFGLCVWQNN